MQPNKILRAVLIERVGRGLAQVQVRAMFVKSHFDAKVDEVVEKLLRQRGAGEAAYGQAQARLELKKYLQDVGYRPFDSEAGTITDLSSDQRLNLILEMTSRLERGERQYRDGLGTAAQTVWPAWEFVRVQDRKEPRDWPTRWEEQGGQFFDGKGSGRAMAYPEAGRMIALKGSSIWTAISAFGLPYPPFDYNSGMGLAPVERAECVRIGLVARGTLSVNKAIQDLNIKVKVKV